MPKIKGVSAEVTDRPIGMKEHAASAPAFVGPRNLDGQTDGNVLCLTVKTACKKLFSFTSSMFLQLERRHASTHCGQRAARKRPRRRTVDSWLTENGSRAAAMLQTILGHLATAYTGVLFIGMVPMVMVLCVPAPSSASAPMSHSEH